MSDLYDRGSLPGWTVEQRAKAVRAVASRAVDVAECVRLLDMLGLNAQESVVSSAERAS